MGESGCTRNTQEVLISLRWGEAGRKGEKAVSSCLRTHTFIGQLCRVTNYTTLIKVPNILYGGKGVLLKSLRISDGCAQARPPTREMVDLRLADTLWASDEVVWGIFFFLFDNLCRPEVGGNGLSRLERRWGGLSDLVGDPSQVLISLKGMLFVTENYFYAWQLVSLFLEMWQKTIKRHGAIYRLRNDICVKRKYRVEKLPKKKLYWVSGRHLNEV